jgi:hypothetical protein
MKKVLMIGQITRYHHDAGNCIHALAKDFADAGWEPIILTTPLPEHAGLPYRVIEVAYSSRLDMLVRRLGFSEKKSIKKQFAAKIGVKSKNRLLDRVFLLLNEIYPDKYRAWKKPAMKKAEELIRNEDIMAVITDNPPIMANVIAHGLKNKYRLPWIVYFSHLFSQNNGYPYGKVRRFLDTRKELGIFSDADVMVTHSETQVDKLRKLYPNKKIFSIIEGYDTAIVNHPPAGLTKKFTITYTGSFTPKFREPTTLFIALQRLLSSGMIDRERLEVRFYGNDEPGIEEEIQKYGLSGIVKQYGRIPMHVAHEKQRESQVLYNPKWNDPGEPGIYSGKIFEYLAARRPILAVGDYRDVVDGLLTDTGAGVSALSVEETTALLSDMYREYLETGEVRYRADPAKLDRYSNVEMVKKFAGMLNGMIKAV